MTTLAYHQLYQYFFWALCIILIFFQGFILHFQWIDYYFPLGFSFSLLFCTVQIDFSHKSNYSPRYHEKISTSIFPLNFIVHSRCLSMESGWLPFAPCYLSLFFINFWNLLLGLLVTVLKRSHDDVKESRRWHTQKRSIDSCPFL